MTTNPADKVLNSRYRLDEQYGSGGMAVVYRATDLSLSRTVAVKILRPSLTSDPSFLTRFLQEARNAANLSHPNIVTVHDFQQDGNTYYIVMEFIYGQDLKKIIRADAPLPLERMLNLGIQICAGIGYAHRAGLAHADVKPQNILITNEEKVKITDFGIAHALAMTKPAEKQKIVWGSPHYFAPEQAQGEYPEPPADVYAIGVVLFEMLTGRLPFMYSDHQELAMAHIREKPPRIIDLNAQVPPQLDNIVQRALSKDPITRYRTADQLGRILIAYKEQGMGEGAKSKAVFQNFSIPEQTPSQGEAAVVPPIPAVSQSRQSSEVNGGWSGQPQYSDPLGIGTSPAPPPPPAPEAVGYEMPPPIYNYEEAPQPPTTMYSRGYRQQEAQAVDMVTLVLAVIALIAVLGVVILWIFVFNAYYG